MDTMKHVFDLILCILLKFKLSIFLDYKHFITRVLKIFTFLKLNFHFLIKSANMNFLNDPFEQSVGWPIRSGVFVKLLNFCSLYLKVFYDTFEFMKIETIYIYIC